MPEPEFLALIDALESKGAIALVIKLAAAHGGLNGPRDWSPVRTLEQWGEFINPLKPMSERQVRNIFAELTERGAIAIEPTGTSYRVALLPQNWGSLKEYTPPERKQSSEETAENEGEQEAKQSGNRLPDCQEFKPLRTKPGKPAKLQKVNAGIAKIQTIVEGAEALITRSIRDGVLTDHIRVAAAALPARSAEAVSPPPDGSCRGVDRPRKGGLEGEIRAFLLPRFDRMSAVLSADDLKRIAGAIESAGADFRQYERQVLVREGRGRGKMTPAAYVRLAVEDLPSLVKQRREIAKANGSAAERAGSPATVDPKQAAFESWAQRQGIPTGPTGAEYFTALERYEAATGVKFY